MTSYVDCADDQQPARASDGSRRASTSPTRPCPCSARWRGSRSCPRDTRERDERCAEVYAIQAQWPGDATAGNGDQEGRARRVGRPRLDTGAPRRGAVHGRPRASRARTCSRTHCRDSPPATRTLARRAPAHGGAGRHGDGDRHPPRRDPDAARPAATRPPPESRSTTGPTRTCRPARGRRCCSAWPTSTTASSSAPATSGAVLGWSTYSNGDHMSMYNHERVDPEDAGAVPGALRRRGTSFGGRPPCGTRCSLGHRRRRSHLVATPPRPRLGGDPRAVDRGHARALRTARLHPLYTPCGTATPPRISST